ncbi:hypothetical protein [Virgisporangium aurantiacum]|uniref:Lipoprotein n=1 Tax=Virgisporangium aurantiacum TaxID=175570 RepID=A0A8J3ZG38_9ACTN|nr:hypothetical protein [Virgisporangium aurantiacum]GIJ60965.1 hypothetical protein Vau01_084810 [Virgisporangium aurantiacum]
MRRALVAVLVVLAAAGCGRPAPIVDYGPSPAPSSSPPVSGSDPVDVYAAAISRYLTGSENSFSGTTFPVVFVLDRLDPAAASPQAANEATTPLSAEQQQRIATRVGGDVRFVSSLDAATTPGEDSCKVVRENGVFIALGPAKATGADTGSDTAEVAVHGFVACLGATWFTYVLRRDPAGWTVTGTTGPMAIS